MLSVYQGRKTMGEKVALVTGAGTGIGRAAARALARGGFFVLLAGRRPEPLQDVQHAIADAGGAADAHPLDVTDETAVDRLFQEISERRGRLDILFNNAGTGISAAPIDEIELSDWRRCVDVNLTGM